MQFHTAPVVITILAGLACASTTTPSSTSHLARRDHRDQDTQFTGTFIMKDNVHYARGYLPIYTVTGDEAYHFNKWAQSDGTSTSSLTYPRQPSAPIITLYSPDDTCAFESHYFERDFPGSSHLSYKIDPRGMKSDRWYFSFVAVDGERFSYHYHRNVLNKGGKVYEHSENKPKRLVARIEKQIRWESWLNPGKHGEATFTLYYDESTHISIQLVTLMALVLNRVETCGL